MVDTTHVPCLIPCEHFCTPAAIFNDDGVYRDESTARERGFEGIPALITFPETHRFQKARLLLYEPEQYYFVEQGAIHGGQEYEISRHPVASEVLTAERKFEEYFWKEGSSGKLLFGVFETEYYALDGKLTVTTTKTRVVPGVKR